MVERLLKGYANLFALDSPTDKGRNEEIQSNDGDTGDAFTSKWGWVAWVDRVAELRRVTWEIVLQYPITEFFNMITYIKDKAAKEADDLQTWKRKN